MKRTFIIVSAIAFGVTIALITASVAMMATGMVKRSVFGGYTFAFETAHSARTLEDYAKKEAIVRSLVATNASLVDTDDTRIKKLVFDLENPSENLDDELVSFNVIFTKDGKTVRIIDTVESISIRSQEKKKVIAD